MAQRILVTGGAGCIGSDLAAALLPQGHEVTVMDNLSSGKEKHIAPFHGNPNFQFIHGDLLHFETVQRAVHNMHIVYHLAANPDVKFTPGDPQTRTSTKISSALITSLKACVAREFGVWHSPPPLLFTAFRRCNPSLKTTRPTPSRCMARRSWAVKP